MYIMSTLQQIFTFLRIFISRTVIINAGYQHLLQTIGYADFGEAEELLPDWCCSGIQGSCEEFGLFNVAGSNLHS